MPESADSGPHSVGPQPQFEPNAEMSVIGLVMSALLAVVLLPLLPFLAVVWVARRFLE